MGSDVKLISLPLSLRQRNAEADAAVAGGGVDAVAPADGAVRVPVMMAAAAETPSVTTSKIWTSVGWYSVQVRANVLTPFPHVT